MRSLPKLIALAMVLLLFLNIYKVQDCK